MPTYQYECESCGHEFEMLQSILEAKLKKCPKCSKNRLQRLIGSGSGIIFKGSGFFVTDYKKKDIPSSQGTTSKETKSASCGSSCGCHGTAG